MGIDNSKLNRLFDSISETLDSIKDRKLPTSMLNLTLQQLTTYSLKALLETYDELLILFKNNKLTIVNLLSILFKENRILFLGTGFLIVSIVMFIFNNFVRIPYFGADKRVFVNNY